VRAAAGAVLARNGAQLGRPGPLEPGTGNWRNAPPIPRIQDR
jgi:hypothetical protein